MAERGKPAAKRERHLQQRKEAFVREKESKLRKRGEQERK